MFLKNKPALLSDASVIRNESADRHNTAERVGAMFIDLINAIDFTFTTIQEYIDGLVADATANLTGGNGGVDLSNYVTFPALAKYATQDWVLGKKYLTDHQDISHLLPKVTFNEVFEVVANSDGSKHLRIKLNVLGDGEITAKANGGSGSAPGLGGASGRLDNLLDVSLSALKNGDGLVYRNGAWRNEPIGGGLDESALALYLSSHNYITSSALSGYALLSDIPSLSGYATEQWVLDKNYLTAHQSLANYYTKNEADNAFQPKGNYLTAHQSLANYYTKNEADNAFQPKGSYLTAHQDISHLLPKVTFNEAFEIVANADGSKHLRIKLNVLGDGEITAKANGGSGSAPGFGTSGKLENLLDVSLSALANGHALVYNAAQGKWVNQAISQGLDESALASYLSSHNYVTSSALSGYLPLTGGALSGNLSIVSGKSECGIRFGGRTASDDFVGRFGTYMSLYNHVGNAEIKLHDNKTVAVSGAVTVSAADFAVMHAYRSAPNFGAAVKFSNADGLLGHIGIAGSQGSYPHDAFFTNKDGVENRILHSGNYSGVLDNRYVTLNTSQEIAGQKIFTQEVRAVANGGIYSDPATGIACGFKTPNPIAAGSFIKSGGTSAQFLKADGSVDSNTYLIASNFNVSVLSCFGWASRATSFTWGNQTGTALSVFNDSTGGSIGFRRDNPVAGQMSAIIDGYWYQQEGLYRCLDTSDITNTLPNTFVKKSGDTMTGLLTIKTDTQPCLKLDSNTANKEVYMYAYSGGVAKACFGWSPNVNAGAYLYNTTCQKTIGIRDDGTPNFAGNIIWHSGNDGSGSGLDADLLDGLHASAFYHIDNSLWNNNETVADYAKRICKGTPGLHSVGSWGWAYSSNLTLGSFSIDSQRYSALDFRTGEMNSAWQQKALLFLPTYTDVSMIYIAQMTTSATAGVVTTSVKRYADYDTILASNVASATKLQTARSLWGNSFNGENGCDGGLTFGLLTGANARNLLYQKMADNDIFRIRCGGTATNAGWVEFATADDGTEPIYVRQYTGEFATLARTLTLLDGSGNTIIPGKVGIGTDSPAYKVDINGDAIVRGWLRTAGATGWYSETYKGGWYMSDNDYIRNYNSKRLRIDGINDHYAVWLTAGGYCCDGYAGAAWHNGYAALNVGIQNNAAQTPLLMAYRAGNGGNHTGANRLFALELLNTGGTLAFGFGGAHKFTMYSSGNFLAQGEITAKSTSDFRLKENIRPVKYAVETLRGLGGYFLFDYKEGVVDFHRFNRIGLIWQNVTGHFGELMGLKRDDGYGALNYIKPDYINLIGAGVLELDDRVTVLEREVKTLKEENAELKRRLNLLNAA